MVCHGFTNHKTNEEGPAREILTTFGLVGSTREKDSGGSVGSRETLVCGCVAIGLEEISQLRIEPFNYVRGHYEQSGWSAEVE